MNILRDHRRGRAIAIITAVIVLVAAVAVFYFSQQKGNVKGSGSALELAKFIPAEAQAAMAWDASSVDYIGWVGDFRELQAEAAMKDKPDELAEFEKELGMKLEEWLEIFDGRGFAYAIVADNPEDTTLVGAIGLAQSGKYDEWWKKQSEGYGKPLKEYKIEGVTFQTVEDEPPFVGHDDTWLYIAASEAQAKTLVSATKSGQNPLSETASFKEGTKELAVKSSGAFFYTDIATLVKKAESAKLPGTDATTFSELSAFQYGIGTFNFTNTQTDGFLKVSGDSKLAKEMLVPGVVDARTLEAFSNKVTNAYTLDLKWLVNVGIKLAMISPDSRGYSAMAGAGLMSQGDPWEAFRGDLTIAGDHSKTIVSSLSGDFGKARSQGQLTACKSNLKNLGVAMEMYSTDWSGKYPTTTGKLAPNYLKTIPICPAANSDTYSAGLKTGPDAPGNEENHFQDYYFFECQGNHHPQAAANYPQYNGIVGLIEGPTVEVAAEEAPETTPEPATVVVATLQDLTKAHAFLNKTMQIGGEPPAKGEEKEYAVAALFGVPDASFKLADKGTPRGVFTQGPGAALLSDGKGSLNQVEPVKELLSWSSQGIVYFDYINLEPAYEALVTNLKSGESDDAKFGLKLAETLKSRMNRLDGGSCIAVKPNGLHYRAVGISNTVFVGVGAAILVPNFIRARAQGQTTACKSNLKNIGTALEMYSTDWSGKYPKDIGLLTPNYLKTIPDCPAAGKNTYSESYRLGGYEDHPEWEVYYVHCAGANHTAVGLPPDHPAYNGVEGLTER